MQQSEAAVHEVELIEGIEYVRRADGPLAADLYRPAGAAKARHWLRCKAADGGWGIGDIISILVAISPQCDVQHQLSAGDGRPQSLSRRRPRCARRRAVPSAQRGEIRHRSRAAGPVSFGGGHLTALIVALAGDLAPFAGAVDDSDPGVSCAVKVAVPVYGCYDLLAQWRHDLLRGDNLPEGFLGVSPTVDRHIYHEASPLTYATVHANKTSFLLVWSTGDDRVDHETQSLPMLEALKQARYYARTIIVPQAPHYWMADPIDEPGSHTGYVAPRLVRFLVERL